ncbi:acyl-CoA N-acyltransferase [Corynespora cassiicola Philippines]|uniref:Acyl-CoA N-acyltransferase n=1 Tax=Corynespora cassiicola Philippines TaxID=1448308 RepID=A0A2T2N6G9_CORCC|nr:acyl-CoA N-acyltransferase [Corynespora cassiicola Philippines]
MSPSYTLCDAEPSDSGDIAHLFALSWTSGFTQLQFGNIDPPILAAEMTPRIAEHMEKPQIRYLVMRNPKTQKAVAVAQWRLPSTDEEDEAEQSTAEKEERQNFEDEAYRNKLPEKSNKDLIMEFTLGLRRLRDRTIKGQKHWHQVLENIATHPEHRGHGLASTLIRWVFPLADDQGALVYLDTATDNEAMRLYKKLGFEIQDTETIQDLSLYGGDGSHSHAALIRYPQNTTE